MVEQVSRALGGLAQTIRGGLRDIARQSIAGAEFGLRTAESGLRATQAELTIGSMRRKEFEEKQKQEFLGAPINFSMLVGRADEIALPDIITNVVPRWERIFGAKLDPKSGQFVKQDGTFVTNRELRQKSGPVMAEFLASVDLGAEFEKNDVRLGIGIDQATTRGDTGLAQELQSKRDANRRKIEDHAANPIPRWQEQLNALTSASVRFQNVADISGVNAKIKTLQDQISDERNRQTAFGVAVIRAGKTTEPKPFTLSPSQVRFGPGGEEIARVEKEDKPLSPVGKLLFDRESAAIGSKGRDLINSKIEEELNKGSDLTGIVKQYFDVIGEKPTIKQLQKFKQDTAVLTKEERSVNTRKAALPKVQAIPPEEAYERGWRMNDDGTVFTELDTGAPVRLPSFEKVMGKRGMTKAVLAAGEQADDAKEVQVLLQDPEVMEGLNAAHNAGMWSRAKGTWSNKIRAWLQRNGYTADSKTSEAVARMGRLASRSRKEFLGTAVTASELRTVQSWIPSIGDSFGLMLTKIRVAVDESDEVFTRFLDVFKNQANMSPFYKAFGIDRFKPVATEGENQELLDIKAKFGLK